MTRDAFERLLRCRPFLTRLARRLLRDDPRADDVVQEAWLIALRRGKGEVEPGWLFGVVRNLVRRLHRDEARRRRRERLVARSEVSAPGKDPVAEDEAHRRLVALVLALPDSYREPILLRYYEGLEPATIAARLGENPSTIRTRLHRALGQLRRGLVADGDGHALCLALARLAWRPETRGAAVAAAGAVAAVLVAALALQGATAPAVRAPPARAEARLRAEAARAPGALRAVERAGPGATVEAPRFLAGEVRLFPGAAPHAVRIEVTAPGTAGGVAAVVHDAFRVPVGSLLERGARSLRVEATHPEAEPFATEVPATAEHVTVRLRRRALAGGAETDEEAAPRAEPEDAAADEAGQEAPGPPPPEGAPDARLRGIVRLPPDVPPGRVLLSIRRGGRSVRAAVAPDREFAVAVAPLLGPELPNALSLTASHEGTRPVRLDVAVHAGPRLARVDARLERARVLRGTVALEGEGPGEGVTVAAYRAGAGAEPESAVQADAQGRFELVLGAAATYRIAAAAEGWRPAGAQPGPAEEELHLVLARGAAFEGRAPAAGAAVRVARADEGPLVSSLALGEARLAWGPEGPAWLELTARADAEARYSAGGLEPVEHVVTCGEEGRRAFPPAIVDFDAPPARLEVAVRSGGIAVANARVHVEGGGAAAEQRTDAAGAAVFELPPAKTWRVTVEAEGHAAQTRVVGKGRAEFDLAPAGDLAHVAVTLRPPPGGPPLAATCTLALAAPDAPDPLAGPFRRTVGMDARGRFVLRDVEPGSWILTAAPDGWHLPAVTPVFLRARETAELSLAVEAGGKVTLEFVTPGGQPTPAAAYADVYVPGVPASDSPVASRWTSGLLPAGACGVLVIPADPLYDVLYLAVAVRPGETVTQKLTLFPWNDPWTPTLPGNEPD